MRDVTFDLRRSGGFATRTQLRASGHSPRRIAAALDAGRCVRVGRSWVALPGSNAEATRALSARGVLGGESALRSYRIWVSHRTGICIATRRTASRLPEPGSGAYRLWRVIGPLADATERWRVGVVEALEQHVPRIADPWHAVATLDSALNRRLVTPSGFETLMRRMPRRIRRLHRFVDGRAESGLETLLRLAILEQGWRVDVQVVIDGVGRVDLVIDGWLVIEADGSAWHDTHEAIANDRERNGALVLRGFRWHRFGYDQIMDDLDGCVAVIRMLLASDAPQAH